MSILILTANKGCGPVIPPLPPPSFLPPSHYKVTDLGPGPTATDLNDKGQVIGCQRAMSGNGASVVPILLWENGKWRTLGETKGRLGFDHRINNRGEVTAFLITKQKYEHAAVLRGGKLKDLGISPEIDYTAARDINDRGQIVGGAGKAIGGIGDRALLWEKGKPPRDLGNLGDNRMAEASAINDNGDVVGQSSVPFSLKDRVLLQRFPAAHAFLWSKGAITDLGILPLPGHRDSKATGISSKKQVVGVSGTMSGSLFLAFVWADGVMRLLPPLPGQDQCYARAINDGEQVVGYSYPQRSRGKNRAVLWQNGNVYDLNTLVSPKKGRILKIATAINRHGQILVEGQIKQKGHYFVLTPL